MFRDETQATMTRAQRDMSVFVGGGAPGQLSPEPEQLAIQYFFTRFMPSHDQDRGFGNFLEGLPSLYASTESSSVLSLATLAISFAAMSRSPPWKHLLPKARSTYSKALVGLHRTLQDSVSATKDETLMAILLLGLVEIHTSNSASPPQWGAHVDGAIALTKQRGGDMLNNKTSLKLLLAVRTRMATSRIQRHVSTAGLLRAMDSDDLPVPREMNPTNSLSSLSALVPPLRVLADERLVQPRMDSTVPLVLDLLERSREIDADFLRWSGNVPESWRYRSSTHEPGVFDDLANESSDLWTRNTDIYSNIWIAKAWNGYRTSRLFLQAICLGSISWLARDSSSAETLRSRMSEYDEAAKLSCQLVDEICSSVPFHLGQATTAAATKAVPVSEPSAADLPGPSNFAGRFGSPFQSPAQSWNGDEARHTEAVGGYFIIWPLFVARSIHTTPERQKTWIDQKIISIATELGLEEAMITARLQKGFQWSLLETSPTI